MFNRWLTRYAWQTIAALMLFLLPVVSEAACIIEASETAVDFGQLNRNPVRATKQTSLPPREVLVQVKCDQQQQMRLRFTGHAGDERYFRFGHGGQLTAQLSAMKLDNHQVTFTNVSPQRGVDPEPSTRMLLSPGDQIVVAGRGEYLTFSLTLQSTFSAELYAVRDDTEVSNDIDIEVVPEKDKG